MLYNPEVSFRKLSAILEINVPTVESFIPLSQCITYHKEKAETFRVL